MSDKTIEQLFRERRDLNQKLQIARPRLALFVDQLVGPTYQTEIIPAKYKHLIGLAASVHGRCDDGILFHVKEAKEGGVSSEELLECLEMCVIDGGSLVYPFIRRAFKTWEDYRLEGGNGRG